MIALRICTQLHGRTLVATLLVLSVFALRAASNTTIAAASTVFPTCSYRQLEVAVASSSGAYSAAGNHGSPFLVVNISRSTCSLEGYPRLQTYPSTYKSKTVKVFDGGGMIFVSVKPKLVVIKPGATASFGLDFGDAADQQDPNAGPCMTQSVIVLLPTRLNPYSQPFNTTVNINFCYSAFHFVVTAIQGGPTPKIG